MGDRSPAGRRDAQRNRKLLTDTAREVFAEQGLHAPLDVIARRAGVGNATLYRHFPTRAALVDEVFRDALTETTAAGERARTAHDAWTGLTEYVRTVFASLAADRGTNDLMTTNLKGVASLEAIHAHNRETIDELRRRGQEQGTVRPDLTTEDLLFMLAALGRTVPALTAVAPDAWFRPLTLLLDGLRADPAAPPLPAPALSSDQLGTVLLTMGANSGT
ncbi:TetR family transcriptional regulator [Streptomyces sp. NPDC028635]|uniref:TetR/AcrR family transcriptional regulator n=1 Tax=Streptomyces sp. NPDC028635 TaxID=3154800 RepID=UPI0033F39E12